MLDRVVFWFSLNSRDLLLMVYEKKPWSIMCQVNNLVVNLLHGISGKRIAILKYIAYVYPYCIFINGLKADLYFWIWSQNIKFNVCCFFYCYRLNFYIEFLLIIRKSLNLNIIKMVWKILI